MSVLNEALAGLVATRINPDPMTQVAPAVIEQVISEGDVNVKAKKTDLMVRLMGIIDDAQASSKDPKVIAGFQKMLDSLS
jgi:hypothetical protein